MLIEEVDIKNFRCFEHIRVPLHSQMNLVVGENGSGKTAFLEAIVSLISSVLTGFDGMNGGKIDYEDIRVVTYMTGGNLNSQRQPATISAKGKLFDKEFDHNDWMLQRLNLSKKGKTSHRNIKRVTDLSKQVQNKLRNNDLQVVLPLISYYSTGRLWMNKTTRRGLQTKIFSRQNGYLDCVSFETDSKKMFEWLKFKTFENIQKNTSPLDLQIVLEAIKNCFLTSKIYKKNIKEVWFNVAEEKLEITFEDGETIPYNHFSDGYRVVIGLVADIAYRMTVLNPNLELNVLQNTPGVVVIDEIDLHLHPRWQSEILKTLASIFPKIQFIVSSHAPSVISSVKKENLILLNNDTVSSDIGLTEIYGKNSNDILEYVMNASKRLNEIQNNFDTFYTLLDDKKFKECEIILDNLSSEIGIDEELTSCRTALEFEKANSL